jgi:hypothetical protein
MGSNTYNRKNYTNKELHKLIEKISGWQSPFVEGKMFETEKQWRAHISRYLDKDSCQRFYYMLEDKHYCHYCKTELGIESYSYSGWNRGFSKYCPACTTNGVWRKNQSYEKLLKRGKHISESKRKFYSTEHGQKTAKENGQKISKSLKTFHNTSAGGKARKRSAIINSKLMRNRILNGEFTPNSNNRNTHWDSQYKDKKYRSSWEALYQYLDPDAKYETLRIPYIFENKECIYIVDFVNHNTKTAIEVKPRELTKDKKTQFKILALKEWCKNNNYTFVLADEEFLLSHTSHIDYALFDKNTANKIRTLYEQNKN